MYSGQMQALFELTWSCAIAKIHLIITARGVYLSLLAWVWSCTAVVAWAFFGSWQIQIRSWPPWWMMTSAILPWWYVYAPRKVLLQENRISFHCWHAWMLCLHDCNAKINIIWWTSKTVRGHNLKYNLPFSRVSDGPTGSIERGAMGGEISLCLSPETVLRHHWAPASWNRRGTDRVQEMLDNELPEGGDCGARGVTQKPSQAHTALLTQ